MQGSSVLTVSPGLNLHAFPKNFSEISNEMSEEFEAKLRLGGSESESAEEQKDLEAEEEEEFSFALTNPDGSPISAEEAFQDGLIRPIFPIFDRSLLFSGGDESVSDPASLRPPLKKLFVEESRDSSSDAEDSSPAEPGTYCEWNGKAAMEASPEMSKKSNSTGFCRLWRFRDLVVRSSSDGKDAFVFLNPNSAKSATEEASEKTEKERKSVSGTAAPATVTIVKKKKKAAETASSVHERHYVRNRAKKEVDKRQSYLPYRPNLVGFFTSVNGLSRNVHPF